MSLPLDGMNRHNIGTTFPRLMPIEGRSPQLSQPGEMVFESETGPVVVSCPLTGVPLTESMARVAGLSEQALNDMISGRAPLGIDGPQQWNGVLSTVVMASTVRTTHAPALADGSLELAVGGSSVGCFSSAQTALEKKPFAPNEDALRQQVRKSPLNRGLSVADLAEVTERALAAYREMDMAVPPQAPWSGARYALGLEGPPDVDIQVKSEIIDRAMSRRAADHPDIEHNRHGDRLGRWKAIDVYEAFPPLFEMKIALADAGVPVDFEFLGPNDRRMKTSPGWWHLPVGNYG